MYIRAVKPQRGAKQHLTVRLHHLVGQQPVEYQLRIRQQALPRNTILLVIANTAESFRPCTSPRAPGPRTLRTIHTYTLSRSASPCPCTVSRYRYVPSVDSILDDGVLEHLRVHILAGVRSDGWGYRVT